MDYAAMRGLEHDSICAWWTVFRKDQSWSGLSHAGPRPHLLLATGRAGDFGFRQQILDHKMERPPDIAVIEPEMDLGASVYLIMRENGGGFLLIVWTFGSSPAKIRPFTGQRHLLSLHSMHVLARWNTIARAHLTIISSETGLGLISANASSRRFVRELGKLNQHTAAHSDEVYFVAAGLRLPLKRT